MSLNCNEIDKIFSEIDLVGAFIQEIVQPSYDSISLYLYKNGTPVTLFICLAPGACRLHTTMRKIPKNNKPLRFMEFMRSRIKGARINSIGQINHDRIIKAELSHGGNLFFMYIRLWSSASNIIITDDTGNILDTFFRRPKKNEVTGGIFSIAENKTESISEKNNQKEWTVRNFEELENYENLSFNQKVEKWYTEHSDTLSKIALLEQAEKWFNSKKSKMENAIQRLESKRNTFKNAEQWKHQGDLILSYAYMIDGTSDYLECTDYQTNSIIRIKIDPKKLAQENAKDYYTTYKKAVSGLENLEDDIKKAKSDIAKLDADYEIICKEQNPIKMQQLIRYKSTPKQQIIKTHPGISYLIDGWFLLIGRDASENDELLRHHVKGHDMWLHARDYSGGYVFIKNRAGKSVPLDILLYAGNLAVWHSKARKAHTADVYYTQVKYLRRAKNGPKGLVLPTQEKNLVITLDNDRLKKLEEYIQS